MPPTVNYECDLPDGRRIKANVGLRSYFSITGKIWVAVHHL